MWPFINYSCANNNRTQDLINARKLRSLPENCAKLKLQFLYFFSMCSISIYKDGKYMYAV